jgi:hypothetical protein
MSSRYLSRKSIEDFKSSLSNGGVRPTMFECRLTLPDYLRNLIMQAGGSNQRLNSFDRDFSMLCKAASIPPSTTTTTSVGLPSGAALKLPGSRIFEPWVCTIIMDGAMVQREILETWSQLILGYSAPRSTMDIENYMASVDVVQLDRQGRGLRTYKLEYAYPSTISAVQLDYGTNDTIEEFECTWNYHFCSHNNAVIFDGEQQYQSLT